MSEIRKFFASRAGIISVGAFIGVLAPLLQRKFQLTDDKNIGYHIDNSV